LEKREKNHFKIKEKTNCLFHYLTEPEKKRNVNRGAMINVTIVAFNIVYWKMVKSVFLCALQYVWKYSSLYVKRFKRSKKTFSSKFSSTIKNKKTFKKRAMGL